MLKVNPYAPVSREGAPPPSVEWNGRELMRRRRAAGISREALAATVRRSANTIGLWESGRQVPSVESLVLLADTIGVSPSDLLTPPHPRRSVDERRAATL